MAVTSVEPNLCDCWCDKSKLILSSIDCHIKGLNQGQKLISCTLILLLEIIQSVDHENIKHKGLQVTKLIFYTQHIPSNRLQINILMIHGAFTTLRATTHILNSWPTLNFEWLKTTTHHHSIYSYNSYTNFNSLFNLFKSDTLEDKMICLHDWCILENEG